MARSFFRFLAGSATVVAAFSMAATPAAAESWGGHGRYHHRHDRGGIDAGDVLAGVLIIGGIAAIASAASKSDNRTDDGYRYGEPSYPYPDDRPEDYREPGAYRGQGGSYGAYSGGGIDNAVSMCTDQVERGNERVANVDNAARTPDGWRISGQLERGGGFDCWIDNDGRIRNVDLGDASLNGSAYPAQDNQWNDDTYARARAQAGYPGDYVGSADERPYYEGSGG
ncbi:hypothetical protein H0274_02695 [Altererythrobacter sp. CC-YST694]|uniref:hypothetical protein n=1 Tax=Altererythrobacter sp. CC-YST694 TaxID=2755038 RepID=UPI001D01E3F2|nr:hypothetical protein [Altererythrobacter sp. CC-YST694]MCB5424156.1 hypothetical protein [Altererythrobacter sp. CC-YST694]